MNKLIEGKRVFRFYSSYFDDDCEVYAPPAKPGEYLFEEPKASDLNPDTLFFKVTFDSRGLIGAGELAKVINFAMNLGKIGWTNTGITIVKSYDGYEFAEFRRK